MSAEALRGFTVDAVNKEIGTYVDALVDEIEAPLDRLRYLQGFVAGLTRAMDLQNDAYKRVGM